MFEKNKAKMRGEHSVLILCADCNLSTIAFSAIFLVVLFVCFVSFLCLSFLDFNEGTGREHALDEIGYSDWLKKRR